MVRETSYQQSAVSSQPSSAMSCQLSAISSQRLNNPGLAPGARKLRRAFTLVELMVVVGIIVLLVSLTVPAIGPMLSSNEESQTVSTINGLLTTAQATAQATGLPVAIRFERAYKVNDRGLMVDKFGQDRTSTSFDVNKGVVWLDYQRARILTFAAMKDSSFRHDTQSKVYSLPRGFWVAPSDALKWDPPALVETKLWYSPVDPNIPSSPPVSYNYFETFYVVISSDGELGRFVAGNNLYADYTQPYQPTGTTDLLARYVDHPKESARGLLLYDRKKWEGVDPANHALRQDFLRTSARALFINRATATVVEGAQP